jgi:pyrimidine oxygenase
MNDCRLSPRPQKEVKIVCAGQSPRGMEFCATWGNYNFVAAKGINTPRAHAALNEMAAQAAAKAGRDVGNYILMMVIADETDEAAITKWKRYNEGTDFDALSWLTGQATADPKVAQSGTAALMSANGGAVNFNMGTLIGSYASVARMLDECAALPATKGIVLVFDDFLVGMEQFGQRIQPLMQCRRAKLAAVA